MKILVKKPFYVGIKLFSEGNYYDFSDDEIERYKQYLSIESAIENISEEKNINADEKGLKIPVKDKMVKKAKNKKR